MVDYGSEKQFDMKKLKLLLYKLWESNGEKLVVENIFSNMKKNYPQNPPLSSFF